VQGSHIVVPRLSADGDAYTLQNPNRRVVFVIPFGDRYSLIGTTDVPYEGDPADVRISSDEVAYLCESVNRCFIRSIDPANVLWSFAGVRALRDDHSSAPSAVTRDYELERMEDGAPLLSVIGGKITTYRRLAEAVLAKLHPFIGGSPTRWTSTASLPGGDIPRGDFEGFVAESQRRWPFLPPRTIRRLAHSYGTLTERIIGPARSIADLGESFGATLTTAEVDYLRVREWAPTAEDVLWRRSKLGIESSREEEERLRKYLTPRADMPHRRVTG